MNQTLEKLSPMTIDVLKEIGNIGVGNAMTALASMIDQKVNMSVPRVGIVPLSDFTTMAGGPEALTAGVYMAVTGDAPGHVAFLLPEHNARILVDQLMGLQIGTTSGFGEMELSALMEVVNIIASSYLNAISDMTELNLYSSPPAVAVDMAAAILGSIECVFAGQENSAVTIVTYIGEEAGFVEGYFIYVPEPGSLSVLLKALQVEE